MRWSRLIGAPVAAVFLCLGAFVLPTRAQVVTAIPVMVGAPLQPLTWNDVESLTALALLSGQGNWHNERLVEPTPVAASSAQFEDQTPATTDSLGCEVFGSTLEILAALAGETVGGRMLSRAYAEYVATMELAAWSVDFGFAYGFCRGRDVTPGVVAVGATTGSSAELVDDPRHSLGNDDALAINRREGTAITARISNVDLYAPISDFYANSWLDGYAADDCGGLSLPVTGLWSRPAPAAAMDATDLAVMAPTAAQPEQPVAAAIEEPQPTPAIDNQLQRELAKRGAQQLLDATAVVLEHLGGSLIDLARVLKPQAPTSVEQPSQEQASVLADDLHLGL